MLRRGVRRVRRGHGRRRGVAVRFGRGSIGRLELAAASPDVFRQGSMIARFHRNADGDVVGFSYSDPLLRGLRFTRRD